MAFYNLIRAFIVSALIVISAHAQTTYPEIIRIKLKPEAVLQLSQAKIRKSSSGYIYTGIQTLDNVNEQSGAIQIKRVYRDGGKFEKRRREFGLHLWYEIQFDNSRNKVSIESRVKNYSELAEVTISEPVYEKRFDNIPNGSLGPIKTSNAIADLGSKSQQFIPDDPRFAEQWHYNNTGQTSGTVDADIDLPEAWNTQKGTSNVIVSVHDGGIDFNHEDLANNMWVNTAEASGTTGVDDDGNGYIDDI